MLNVRQNQFSIHEIPRKKKDLEFSDAKSKTKVGVGTE